MKKLLVLLCLIAGPVWAQSTLKFPAYVSGLPAVGTVQGTDYIYLLRGTISEKATVSQITAALSSAITIGATIVTGGINGDCFYNNAGIVGDQSCATGAVTPSGTFTAGDIMVGAGSTSIKDSAIPIYAAKYGVTCDWNGTTGTDNGPLIQDAIDYIEADPSHIYKIVLPPGGCLINSGLTITGNNVFIVGQGSIGYGQNGTVLSYTAGGTVLIWGGTVGSTMISFATPTAATTRNYGGGVFDLALFSDNNVTTGAGSNTAAVGIDVVSWVSAEINNVTFYEFSTAGLRFTTKALSATTINDVQHNFFTNIVGVQQRQSGADILLTASGDGGSGGAIGNASINVGINLTLYHKNGPGIEFGDSDHNRIVKINGFGYAAGYGIQFDCGTTNLNARYNVIIGGGDNKGILSQGTDTCAGGSPATNNVLQFYPISQYPAPVNGTGATTNIMYDDAGTYGTIQFNSSLATSKLLNGPSSNGYIDGSFNIASGRIDIQPNIVMTGAHSPTQSALYWHGSLTGTCNNSGVVCGGGIEMVASPFQTTEAAGSVPSLAYFKASVGGAPLVGGVFIGDFYLEFTGTSGNPSTVNYQALNVLSQVEANDNGTMGTYAGNMYAAGIGVDLTGTATFWNAAHAIETGISVRTGASVHYVDGISVVLRPINAVAGDRENTAFLVGAGSGAVPTITCAYCIGGYEGFNPLAAGAKVMTFSPNGGSHAGPSITGGIDFTAFTFSGNAFASPGFAVDGSGDISISNTLAVSGAPATTNRTMTLATTLTGTPTGSTRYASFESDLTDKMDGTTTTGGAPVGWYFNETYGASGSKGSRIGSYFQFNLNGGVIDGTAGHQFTALATLISSNQNIGGTSPSPVGAIFGANPYARLGSGATFWNQIVGTEIDMSVRTGASVFQTIGLQIDQDSLSAVAPTGGAWGIDINGAASKAGGTITGLDYLITDGGGQGYNVLNSTGTVFTCYLHAGVSDCGQIANGFLLTNYASITGYAFASPGFSVDGSGNVIVNSCTGCGGITPIYLSVYLSANQTGMTTATPTKVTYNTVEFDSGSYYDHTTNYRYTPLVAGKYDCTHTLTEQASGTGTGLYIAMIYKNGSLIKQSYNTTANTNSFEFTEVAHALVTMNGSTDYLEAWGEVSGSSITGFITGSVAGANSHLECFYVGP